MSRNVAIIGAGITGLTCAMRLSELGHSVVIYESESEAGGLARTFRADGFAFDLGPHEFCTNNPPLVKRLEEVLGDRLLSCGKRTAQLFHGRLMDYPAPVSRMLATLPAGLVLRIGAEVLASRIRETFSSNTDFNFERWVESRFGKTLYRSYFAPYTRKVWGISPNLLDARTASSRIAYNSVFDLVIKTTRHFLLKYDYFSRPHSPLKAGFRYSTGGIGTLCDALAERCLHHGARIEFGRRLAVLDTSTDAVTGLRFADGSEADGFDHVISTAPLPALLGSLGLPVAYLPLRFRSMVFVMLGVDTRPVSRYSWIYLPDTDIPPQRMTEFADFEPGMAPAGASGICMEIACFEGDEIWSMSDSDLVEWCRLRCTAAGLLPDGEPVLSRVVREAFAYPLQVCGYPEIVGSLLRPLEPLRNLITTGRQGLFKYCNMDECMEMALAVAEQVHEGRTDSSGRLTTHWRGAGLDSV